MDNSINSSLNGKILNVAIDFNFIINTEMGLIRFIRENFQDERVFKLDILNKSDREILSLLYSRININPLYIISTEENLHDIDELYKSFFNQYKKDILKKSTSEKNILDFISMISNPSGFGFSSEVFVSDDLEKDLIKKHFPNIKIEQISNTKSLLSKDVFYINDLSFMIKNNLEDIMGKKIYLFPKQYSIEFFVINNNHPMIGSNVFTMFGNDHRNDELKSKFSLMGDIDNGTNK